ncbi:MAG: hypothetical protein ACRCVW_01510 [Brevinema sp.]
MEKSTHPARYYKRKKNKTQEKNEKKVEKNEVSPGSHQYTNKNQSKHHKNDVPKWDHDHLFKSIEFKETKAELMEILSQTNPDEIMITPLVSKNKRINLPKIKKQPTLGSVDSKSPESSLITVKDVELTEKTDENISTIASEIEPKKTNTITIDITQTCPICERAIREIMYALHDYEHDCLAHFDCVYKKVSESIKDKLSQNKYLVYLGSGSFGIMENNNKKLTLIEKIYPGAPIEEMLHSDEAIIDDEI